MGATAVLNCGCCFTRDMFVKEDNLMELHVCYEHTRNKEIQKKFLEIRDIVNKEIEEKYANTK